ncbi:MAG: YihY/virulence factor BrkB family protein [Eubacterium sp.]|jgi:membrane protein|nr:YihY/virulence factor BrkB family protein [Eubacterium sp.]
MKLNKILRLALLFKEKFPLDVTSAYAAHASFFIFLSIFPFTLFLLNLLRYLPIDINSIIDDKIYFLSQDISVLVNSIINEIYLKSSGTIMSIASFAAFWSASKGFLGVINGLNVIYSVSEKRGYIKLRLTSILYTLVMVTTLAAALGFLVFGEKIGNRLKLRGFEFGITPAFRWLAGIIILILFFMFIYTVVPERKTRFLNELPGAVISALGWVVFSLVFSFYINNFADFNYLYGNLASIVLLLLWLYFCMSILFFGAGVNCMLRKKKANLKCITFPKG